MTEVRPWGERDNRDRREPDCDDWTGRYRGYRGDGGKSDRGSQTAREMVAGRISFTTGEATITLEGPNITLEAAANILLRATENVTITGQANIRVEAARTFTSSPKAARSLSRVGQWCGSTRRTGG